MAITIPSTDRIQLTECLLRDGLQSIERVLTTQEKLALLDRIVAAGFSRIEVTSFVPPKYLPQFYDADEMMAQARARTDATLIAFVPNARGMERVAELAEQGLAPDRALLVVSASEEHNRKNLKRSIAETKEDHRRAAEIAHRAGVEIEGSISVSFGCPYSGDVPHEAVLDRVAHYRDIGAVEVQFGDTTGEANPISTRRLYETVVPELGGMEPVAHFHDARGLAIVNSMIASEFGVRIIDTSLGALGGRPPDQRVQAAGPTGNTSSEDLANALEEMGIATGLDVDAVIAAGRELQDLLGEELFSHTTFAGRVRHATKNRKQATSARRPAVAMVANA